MTFVFFSSYLWLVWMFKSSNVASCISVSSLLGIDSHILAENKNLSTSIQPTHKHSSPFWLLFISFSRLPWQCNPAVSDCVRGWHTKQCKQGSTVYFHSSLHEVPAVWCLCVLFFSPCVKVFVQRRNLGGSVIFISWREIHRNSGGGLGGDQRKLKTVQAKIATQCFCVVNPLHQSKLAVFSHRDLLANTNTSCW